MACGRAACERRAAREASPRPTLYNSLGCQPRRCGLCSSRPLKRLIDNADEQEAITRDRKENERREIEGLREAVSCAAVLEEAGFAVDAKESTRRAVKFRRSSEIVIVTHEGRGWFDP